MPLTNWTQSIARREYKYSDSVVVRKWHGGKLTVKVGYVAKHPEKNCIVLEKFWTGKKQEHRDFNIKSAEDWRLISETVLRLWPELSENISEDAIKNAVSKVASQTQILELASQYPDLFKNLPEDVNILRLPDEQKKALVLFLGTGEKVATEALKKLAGEPIKDVEGLVEILESYRLSTVNALTTHITGRLSFIDKFEQIILDDSSFERRGPESVHNLLKANMWLINPNYVVLSDDESLKEVIYKNYARKYTGEDAKKRPDFLCMANQYQDNGLRVLIEIKRPSKKISFSMLEQIVDYQQIIKSHSGKKDLKMEAYMIGRELEPAVQNNPFEQSGITVKTYTDFIGEARRHYSDYQKIVAKESYSL